MGKYFLAVTENAAGAQTIEGHGVGKVTDGETQGTQALQSSSVRQMLVDDSRVLVLRSFQSSR